jgi:thiol:disulfide interchange protein
MTLLGIHGTNHIAFALLAISAPFWLLSWFDERLHPDTLITAMTLYGGLVVVAGTLFIIGDEQQSDPLSAAIWVFVIAMTVWATKLRWNRWFRQRAEDAG